MSASDDFQKILEENPIVLFMKGNAAFPMDSFGATVVQYLNDVGYRPRTIDILQDPEIKRSLRDATHATPPPVLYINGELVGGYDTILDRLDSGDLERMLSTAKARP